MHHQLVVGVQFWHGLVVLTQGTQDPRNSAWHLACAISATLKSPSTKPFQFSSHLHLFPCCHDGKGLLNMPSVLSAAGPAQRLKEAGDNRQRVILGHDSTGPKSVNYWGTLVYAALPKGRSVSSRAPQVLQGAGVLPHHLAGGKPGRGVSKMPHAGCPVSEKRDTKRQPAMFRVA